MSQIQQIILRPDERQTITNEAYRLLEDTGVEVQGQSLRQRFAKMGIRVGTDHRVSLPEALARKLINQVPKTIQKETLRGQRIKLGGGERLFSSLVLDPVIVDYQNGPRSPRLSDVIRHTIIGDALPLVKATYKMDQGLEGLTPERSNLHSITEFLSNTTHHVLAAPADRESLTLWIEMVEVALEGLSPLLKGRAPPRAEARRLSRGRDHVHRHGLGARLPSPLPVRRPLPGVP